jgi:hypothetical protein
MPQEDPISPQCKIIFFMTGVKVVIPALISVFSDFTEIKEFCQAQFLFAQQIQNTPN